MQSIRSLRNPFWQSAALKICLLATGFLSNLIVFSRLSNQEFLSYLFVVAIVNVGLEAICFGGSVESVDFSHKLRTPAMICLRRSILSLFSAVLVGGVVYVNFPNTQYLAISGLATIFMAPSVLVAARGENIISFSFGDLTVGIIGILTRVGLCWSLRSFFIVFMCEFLARGLYYFFGSGALRDCWKSLPDLRFWKTIDQYTAAFGFGLVLQMLSNRAEALLLSDKDSQFLAACITIAPALSALQYSTNAIFRRVSQRTLFDKIPAAGVQTAILLAAGVGGAFVVYFVKRLPPNELALVLIAVVIWMLDASIYTHRVLQGGPGVFIGMNAIRIFIIWLTYISARLLGGNLFFYLCLAHLISAAAMQFASKKRWR